MGQVSTEGSLPPPSITHKRKRKASEQTTPTRPPTKASRRSSSVLNISSDDDNDAHQAPKSSQASVDYWSQQPDYDSDVPDEGLLELSQQEPAIPSTSEPTTSDVKTEPNLCKEQQDLIDLIMSGRNVFFTGSAGCGKSTVLKAAVERLRLGGRNVQVIAPTGKAALQVGGITTWSYMGWTPADHKKPLSELQNKGFRTQVQERLQKTEVLIIDEISMVENHHLERINQCMKAVKCYAQTPQKYRPDAPAFGGAQVIVTGDFCQLSPVKPFKFCYLCGNEFITDEDGDEYNCDDGHGPFSAVDMWAFRSSAWEEANFAHVNLDKIHRQSDQSFVRMLQKCRLGIPFTTAEANTLGNHQCDVRNATQLFATNSKVNELNQKKFDQVPGEEIIYDAVDGFDWNVNHLEIEQYSVRTPDGLLKACENHQLDPFVELKTGALVMLKVNLDLPRGLVNGSQGIVCGWEKFDPAKLPRAYKKNKSSEFDIDVLGGDYAKLRERQVRAFADQQAMKDWPIVQFHNGVKRTIYPWCVVTAMGSTEPYSLLYRTQVPLALAWALSIHKSQGMTLNRVIVDLSRSWEHSQIYVALSRATSLGGLRVIGGREGLDAGRGANPQVREFLLARFGERLFRSHGDSMVGS